MSQMAHLPSTQAASPFRIPCPTAGPGGPANWKSPHNHLPYPSLLVYLAHHPPSKFHTQKSRSISALTSAPPRGCLAVLSPPPWGLGALRHLNSLHCPNSRNYHQSRCSDGFTEALRKEEPNLARTKTRLKVVKPQSLTIYSHNETRKWGGSLGEIMGGK